MRPFELSGQNGDGKTVSVWACGVCGCVRGNEDDAARCCVCSYCGLEVPLNKYGCCETYHNECQRAAWAKQDKDRMDKAVEVTDYDGPFLVGDTYYQTMDDVVEHLECCCESDEDWPEFIYACKEKKPCFEITLDDLECKFDDLWEEAEWDNFHGVRDLEAALTAFNALNADRAVYYEDRTRKVRVPRRDDAAEAEGGEWEMTVDQAMEIVEDACQCGLVGRDEVGPTLMREVERLRTVVRMCRQSVWEDAFVARVASNNPFSREDYESAKAVYDAKTRRMADGNVERATP